LKTNRENGGHHDSQYESHLKRGLEEFKGKRRQICKNICSDMCKEISYTFYKDNVAMVTFNKAPTLSHPPQHTQVSPYRHAKTDEADSHVAFPDILWKVPGFHLLV
jgi:hypothetical protein